MKEFAKDGKGICGDEAEAKRRVAGSRFGRDNVWHAKLMEFEKGSRKVGLHAVCIVRLPVGEKGLYAVLDNWMVNPKEFRFERVDKKILERALKNITRLYSPDELFKPQKPQSRELKVLNSVSGEDAEGNSDMRAFPGLFQTLINGFVYSAEYQSVPPINHPEDEAQFASPKLFEHPALLEKVLELALASNPELNGSQSEEIFDGKRAIGADELMKTLLGPDYKKVVEVDGTSWQKPAQDETAKWEQAKRLGARAIQRELSRTTNPS